jgi:hypothetical protein
VFLSIERRAVAPESETALRRLALPPSRIGVTNVVARLPPAEIALEELVDERVDRERRLRTACV